MCLQFSKYDSNQNYFLEKIKMTQIRGKHATVSTEFSKIYGGEIGGTCQTDGQTHRHNFHWNIWKERKAWKMYSSFETLKQMDLEGRKGTAQCAAVVNNIRMFNWKDLKVADCTTHNLKYQ